MSMCVCCFPTDRAPQTDAQESWGVVSLPTQYWQTHKGLYGFVVFFLKAQSLSWTNFMFFPYFLSCVISVKSCARHVHEFMSHKDGISNQCSCMSDNPRGCWVMFCVSFNLNGFVNLIVNVRNRGPLCRQVHSYSFFYVAHRWVP